MPSERCVFGPTAPCRLGLCDAINMAQNPRWRAAAEVPEEDAALSLWLGARLPLSTPVRTFLLSCTCPLKRMQDCVDAMTLLLHRDPRFAMRRPGQLPRLQVLLDTAEASGCELAPPRKLVGWASR